MSGFAAELRRKRSAALTPEAATITGTSADRRPMTKCALNAKNLRRIGSIGALVALLGLVLLGTSKRPVAGEWRLREKLVFVFLTASGLGLWIIEAGPGACVHVILGVAWQYAASDARCCHLSAAGNMRKNESSNARRDRGECQDRGTTTPLREGAGYPSGR